MPYVASVEILLQKVKENHPDRVHTEKQMVTIQRNVQRLIEVKFSTKMLNEMMI